MQLARSDLVVDDRLPREPESQRRREQIALHTGAMFARDVGLLRQRADEQTVHAFKEVLSVANLPRMRDVPAIARLTCRDLVFQHRTAERIKSRRAQFRVGTFAEEFYRRLHERV